MALRKFLHFYSLKSYYYKTGIRCFKNTSVEDVPHVSPNLIKRIFKSNNVNFEEGYTCFTTNCPMCVLTKAQSKIYVNKTTGLFCCPTCKYYGDWDMVESSISSKNTSKHVLDVKNVENNCSNILSNLKNVQSNSLHLKDVDKNNLMKLWKSCNLPVISLHLLENIDIRVDSSLTNLYFPLYNANSEIVSYKVIGHNQNKLTQNHGGLLIGNKPKSKDTAILVSNISDFLVLYASSINFTIVGLANGIKTLPQQDLPVLEKFKKIILWLGNDIISCDAAKKFGKKLGEKRCLHVKPSKKYVMPHEDPTQDFKSIIGQAQNLWHKSITTFATLRQDVLSDLQNLDQVQGVKWKRFPTLNKLLKGHRLGELTVITGPTGSGKTTFISEYSLDLAMQGVNTLWGSFEIRNARLARTMLQQMVGMPLDHNLEFFDQWADQFELLPIYYMTFHGQQSIKVVMEAVEHATYVHDINHVIIDNVQFMMGMSDEAKHLDRFWKQDAIISEFRSFATRKNCHVTLVIHPRKERTEEELTTNSIFGGAKASQEADNVLLIQDKRLSSIKGKKYLQIAKNRYSGDLGIMPLDFDKNGLSYEQKKKQKSDKPKETLDGKDEKNQPNDAII